MVKNKLASLIFSLIFLSILYLSSFINKSTFNKEVKKLILTPTPTEEAKVQGESKEVEIYLVKRIIDGDTIELENGEKLRYIGIDTPEKPESTSSSQCFAKESFEKNKELVLGKKVRLEKDVSERDRYGRLLRYVYVDFPPNSETPQKQIFVNYYLVREGYATALTYPPDVKYSAQFIQAEREARENAKGLWNLCK